MNFFNNMSEWYKKSRKQFSYGVIAFFEMMLYMTVPLILVIVILALSQYGVLKVWMLFLAVIVYGLLMEILRRRLKSLYTIKSINNEIRNRIEKYNSKNRKRKRDQAKM